tara:strand:+ start:333 stop:1262 length:930 start_codon:yes stop_codon:yes gene_type:complete
MIIILGSLNIDMYIPAEKIPAPGESIRCADYTSYPGGKGANQAYAAARAGAKTALIGRIGDDAFGRRSTYNLKKQGILGSGIGIVERPTGCTFILPGTGEENTVIHSPGANFETTSEQIPNEILKSENTVIGQLLIPTEQTIDLFTRARERGTKTVLNASPARYITKDILELTDILIVNEIELKKAASVLGLSDEKPSKDLAAEIHKTFKIDCIVTLGSKGVFAAWRNEGWKMSAFDIEVKDPTGAGDCFLGYLMAMIDMGHDFKTALKYATIAGSMACRKEGAQTSVPYIDEVTEALESAPNPEKVEI